MEGLPGVGQLQESQHVESLSLVLRSGFTGVRNPVKTPLLLECTKRKGLQSLVVPLHRKGRSKLRCFLRRLPSNTFHAANYWTLSKESSPGSVCIAHNTLSEIEDRASSFQLYKLTNLAAQQCQALLWHLCRRVACNWRPLHIGATNFSALSHKLSGWKAKYVNQPSILRPRATCLPQIIGTGRVE